MNSSRNNLPCLAVIAVVLLLTTGGPALGQVIKATPPQVLGVDMRPEIRVMIAEIEKKCGHKLYAEFTEQEDFMLAQSFVDEDGIPVVLVDPKYERAGGKLEAIIIHELLHLRLRVNNYAEYIFSPDVKTQRGRAIDVEQGNLNDLRNLVEHHIFKADMARYGVDKLLDLSGDTARIARQNKGREGSNADIINYTRAILEYLDPKDTAEVEKAYAANGWARDLKAGREIADIISGSVIKTPADAEAVFLRCLPKLYPLPNGGYFFKLTPDPANKLFRRMVVSVGKRAAGKK